MPTTHKISPGALAEPSRASLRAAEAIIREQNLRRRVKRSPHIGTAGLAQLIDHETAAPELLAALKEYKRLYEEVQPRGGWQGVYELGNDAIAKAERA